MTSQDAPRPTPPATSTTTSTTASTTTSTTAPKTTSTTAPETTPLTAPPAPLAPEPDTKDWTWTLRQACPDCGFEAASVPGDDLPAAIADGTAPWSTVLARAGVRDRPSPTVWSPLEYACHVRDVCRLFDRRLRLMLSEDDPAFDNWDQDETAIRSRYDLQDPAAVAREIADAATHFAETYAGVSGLQWSRTGRRSDGSVFTVLTLGQYALHDLMHHLWDVKAS